MPKPPIPLFLFLLLLLHVSLPALSSPSTLGLDAFLSSSSRDDPLATNDSFPSLPPLLAKSLAASLPPSDLTSHLLSLHISVPIYVKLVGAFSSSAPSLLQSFVSAALSSAQFHSIGPSSTPTHHLSLSHSLHLDPSLSPLGSQISAAIRSHLESAPAPLHRSALLPVPYAAVDGIVRDDYLRDSVASAPGFYIYLLNLDRKSKPYAYAYETRDASPGYSKCLGTLWTGAERYVWIDLAAGPIDYGPAISGEGVLPRGDFHPLAALHRGPRAEKALLADLASLVLSAYRTLLVPSLRIPVFFEPSLVIKFVHIHGSDDARDSTGLDFGAIERTIKESKLEFRNQPLKFESYSVKFSDCPICSFAISRASNSFTARFLFENYTLIASEYLDSKLLHKILSDSVDDVHRSAGITEELQFSKVLPVYVFDLDYDKLLMLDRYHQAIAFRDMVIAVRTRISQTVGDYSCNGRHVITQTRNLDRPIVGSILQSMWGIAPTHLSWSPQHNNTLVDYTWSVGQTPFGPFSESLSLSFVQKDAARRNVLLTSLNYTITSTIDIVESMAAHGGDRKLLKRNRRVEFVQRWNLLNYKLKKVVSAMSQLDFDKAMYFLKSSDHDLYALHTLVYQATQELEASLVCFKDPPFPWVSASMAGVLLFALLYVYAKRDRIFKSKRKQF